MNKGTVFILYLRKDMWANPHKNMRSLIETPTLKKW